MNFRDTWEYDSEGKKFVFTVEMKRSLAEKGMPIEVASLNDVKNNRGNDRDAQTAESGAKIEPDVIQIDPETGKYLGRLKWYSETRGYGFISRGGGEDIFFHKSGSIGDPNNLAEGQLVLYDVEERQKGPEATEVEPYEGDPG